MLNKPRQSQLERTQTALAKLFNELPLKQQTVLINYELRQCNDTTYTKVRGKNKRPNTEIVQIPDSFIDMKSLHFSRQSRKYSNTAKHREYIKAELDIEINTVVYRLERRYITELIKDLNG